jgi:hypothetical protein
MRPRGIFRSTALFRIVLLAKWPFWVDRGKSQSEQIFSVTPEGRHLCERDRLNRLWLGWARFAVFDQLDKNAEGVTAITASRPSTTILSAISHRHTIFESRSALVSGATYFHCAADP